MEERRITVLGAAAAVKWYVIGVFTTATVTIVGVVLCAIFAPDNTSAITSLIGITAPIILTLLSLGQRAMAVSQDGLLSRLVKTSEDKARVEGVIEGLKVNPKTNVD